MPEGAAIFEAKEKLLSQLGWSENPFVKDLRVYDKESFIKYYCPFEAATILQRLAFDTKACMLLGPKGVGKTSALYYILFSLPPQEFSVVFFKEAPRNLYELAKEAGAVKEKSFFSKLFAFRKKEADISRKELAERIKASGKKTVFFLDEAHLADLDMHMEFKYLLDEVPNLRLVISALGKENFPDSLLQLVGENNIFHRSSFSKEEMTQIISHRLSAVGGRERHPFPPAFLQSIYTEQNLLTPRYVFDELNNYLASLALGKAKPTLVEEDLIVKSAIEYSQGGKGEEQEMLTKLHADWWVLLSPSQQRIMSILLAGEGLSLSEILEKTSFKQDTAFNALRQLEGRDKAEQERKPTVPFPLISVERIQVGKRPKNIYYINQKIKNLFTLH
ncbi:ATP-binding protein [Candidatus Micrarchaeota archaeon]|nr:ATP-binding protein [Candidatus Micrarchaeota archaeon]